MERGTSNNTLFMEEWLRSKSGSYTVSRPLTSSARAIIQAWTDLRASLQNQIFNPNHLQALKTLHDSRTSLHVADQQAKLLISVLKLSLPSESYGYVLRLLYIWIRKSFRPSSQVVDSALEVLSHIIGSVATPSFSPEAVLLLGAFACVPSVSQDSKIACVELLCCLLEGNFQTVMSHEHYVSEILAGIGYALSSPVSVHCVRLLDSLFGCWGKQGFPCGNVTYGLMILHLIEWLMSDFIKSNSIKIQNFIDEVLETSKPNYSPFAIIMAAAGVLRATSRQISGAHGFDTVTQLRSSAGNRMGSVAQDLIISSKDLPSYGRKNPEISLLLQCFSLALARSGPVSFSAPLFICLASALLTEVFPLLHVYKLVLESDDISLALAWVKQHLTSVLFREAGEITGVFCNQYVSANEENKSLVECMMWDFCQDLYLRHRLVALLLLGLQDELLGDIEKISESAFLMIVVFALAVTKQRIKSTFSLDKQMVTSVKILISLSCVEYFRRIRVPEYMDTIRGVVSSIQENEFACVSFAESMPSYNQLTNLEDTLPVDKYLWYKDDVQTARILFYMRVIPTCIGRLPAAIYSRMVVPTMFLYMGHPNGKVARASHSLFVAFISSGKDSDEDERVALKEKLVFYYVQRSLEGYPGITPFEGMASGVAALVRHLPAGSPSIFYCVDSLVKKTAVLCSEGDINSQGESEFEFCKKNIELLSRLISLVDIQVLPNFMKLLAQLVLQLPKDTQAMVLDELHTQVSESDDVTRKTALVSWLQSLNYLCSHNPSEQKTSKVVNSSDGLNARL